MLTFEDAPDLPPIEWNVADTLDWIVIREVPAPVITSHIERGRATSPNTLAALQARVSGNPREWRGPNCPQMAPAWWFRARVRQWMRESGLSAPDLLQAALAQRAEFEKVDVLAAEQASRYAAALEMLNNAVRAGRIEARGRPSKSHSTPRAHRPREPIPAGIIDELRRIDFWGQCRIRHDAPGFEWLHDPGPFFYDVCFRVADVMKLWPAKAAADPPATGTPSAPPEEGLTFATGAAGRPTSWHIVEPEWLRRQLAGAIEPTRTAQAETLSKWLGDTHPKAAPMGKKAIYNRLPASLWLTGATARNNRPK